MDGPEPIPSLSCLSQASQENIPDSAVGVDAEVPTALSDVGAGAASLSAAAPDFGGDPSGEAGGSVDVGAMAEQLDVKMDMPVMPAPAAADVDGGGGEFVTHVSGVDVSGVDMSGDMAGTGTVDTSHASGKLSLKGSGGQARARRRRAKRRGVVLISSGCLSCVGNFFNLVSRFAGRESCIPRLLSARRAETVRFAKWGFPVGMREGTVSYCGQNGLFFTTSMSQDCDLTATSFFPLTYCVSKALSLVRFLKWVPFPAVVFPASAF